MIEYACVYSTRCTSFLKPVAGSMLLSTIEVQLVNIVCHQRWMYTKLKINKMIECHFLALIMCATIHGSKVDSLENPDSDVKECSEGVGWKSSDPGNENVWKVSRKNLDIILYLDRLLTRIQCISSMSIAIEGEIFRYSTAPEERVILKSKGWQGCTSLGASVTVVDKEGRMHRREEILKPVQQTTCAAGIGWRNTETEDVWKVSQRTVTLLPHMLALRPQLIRLLSIAVGMTTFEIPSPGSAVILNVPNWNSCSRIKASVTAWDNENVMHRRQDLLAPKESMDCAGIGWQKDLKPDQLWRTSENSVILLVHMLALRPKQIRTMVVVVGREMIEIPYPPTRITLYNTEWNRCSPVQVTVTVWDLKSVMHRREDILDPIQHWKETSRLEIQRNEFAPSILRWMSQDFSRCLVSATLSSPGLPDVSLEKNASFVEVKIDHCQDNRIVVHYKFKGDIDVRRVLNIKEHKPLCMDNISPIEVTTERVELTQIVTTVGGGIGVCLLIFVIVAIFTAVFRWKRDKKAEGGNISLNTTRLFMRRSRRRSQIQNSLRDKSETASPNSNV